MRALIACEESQTECMAFRALGLERNKANSFCKEMLAARDLLLARGFQIDVNWENIFEFLVSDTHPQKNRGEE